MKKITDLSTYEIRTGRDGKVGIYTRNYNVRLATFNANTTDLQKRLAHIFGKAKPLKKPPRVRLTNPLRFGDQ